MQGQAAVIDALNALLAGELAARDQYLFHAHVLADAGLARIAARIAHESTDEAAHAEVLIQRILMLGGLPRMVPAALNVATDLPTMLANDLAVEVQVTQHLREVIALCETQRDYVTRDLLLPLLVDTEQDHAHWLEQQLRLIQQLGLPHYLQSQQG